MSKKTNQQQWQGKTKKYTLVKYSLAGTIGLFEYSHLDVDDCNCHSRVVIKTDKGLEIGELVGCHAAGKDKILCVNPKHIAKYYCDSGVNFPERPLGSIIRLATKEDLHEHHHLQGLGAEEIEFCEKTAKTLGLQLEIVDVEHIFGGERIVFYFMSDGRIDFRELVKRIAHEYQTRIEMRQIGSRDEAKFLADVETCGQQCCCQRFLRVLKPVNMRMAKMQKATLDPAKISGYCGRLRCCLRYEDQNYTQLKKNLPHKNTHVDTPEGSGRVIGSQILTQLVMVRLDSDSKKVVAINVDEIEPVTTKPIDSSKSSDSAPADPSPNKPNQNNKPRSASDSKSKNRRRRSRPDINKNTNRNAPQAHKPDKKTDNKPVNNKPADNKADDNKVADNKPANNKPADNAAENKKED